MKKITPVSEGLNAFKLKFNDHYLDEIRNSYHQNLEHLMSDKNNQHLFDGGVFFKEVVPHSSENYFLTSFGTQPLLWFSCNNKDTYNLFMRFFNHLDIHNDLKELVDYDENIIMYCGFFVIGNQATNVKWHVDYLADSSAYTLITPLFELDDEHGNLLYETKENTVGLYKYSMNEAIIFGENFLHSTEPYEPSNNKRILLSLTFGTDKIKYWDSLKHTVGVQSKFIMLPCGHQLGTCSCINTPTHNEQPSPNLKSSEMAPR